MKEPRYYFQTHWQFFISEAGTRVTYHLANLFCFGGEYTPKAAFERNGVSSERSRFEDYSWARFYEVKHLCVIKALSL